MDIYDVILVILGYKCVCVLRPDTENKSDEASL